MAGTKAEKRNWGQVLNDLDCHAKELVTPLGAIKITKSFVQENDMVRHWFKIVWKENSE